MRGDPRTIVVGMATVKDQDLVQASAAVCSYLISTGMFKPADKYQDYYELATHVCDVDVSPGSFRYRVDGS